jgi:hypothetical protein
MPLMTPLRCWRGRDDCEPLHSIESNTTEEQYEDPDHRPDSFVCCGISHSSSRHEAQDCYRLCFKNAETDTITDNDQQDLTHTLAVISQALAITAARQVRGGTIEVPTMQGDPIADATSSQQGTPRPAGG